ncbi:MAG: S41 family peptidase [Bacteroidales bacterium]|jgi:carboxyl-terminal processing protease|nr:S41 family peptidase [Bacteroidales bacterium]NCU35688.1 S41 family peptidase [Candidatus Falkowbacteria bacterium]MDD2632527.1 S41 family peptidase [Bacteroidales bacterium]MDD3132429.1 S41 family peptidase [Bacteroidales bacterium]MDD3526731.1 S41 family peptidase [Bacteroidales bacterium]
MTYPIGFLPKRILQLVTATAIFVLLSIPHVQAQTDEQRQAIQKFGTALQIINFAYVDSVDSPELVASAIKQMLKELDPHSAYISKEDVERVNEPLEGSFEGIGVTFQIFNDTILVVSPVPGGPSDKLGIFGGDKIVKIDGKSATGEKINNEYVMERLRGKKGTTVSVSIKRAGKKALIDFDIVRDKIPLNSIDASYMAAPEIGYIKLTRFSKTSMDEFRESVQELRQQGMQDLILDLRSNSGGYLNIAVELSDEFLPDNRLIVYTEGLRNPRENFSSTSTGSFDNNGRVIVLINEASASASEIVAGAIQDWDRGLVLGRRSFGKGLVQRPFRLPDGALIRLTTARYHTPTGRCIQKPYDEGVEEYFKDFKNRLEHGELVSADSIHFPDSLQYLTPAGRTVYGGGGIMPDIFIPIDSTRFSDYYIDLVRKMIFNTYTMSYLDKNRAQILRQYPDVDAFKTGFVVDDEMYSDFKAKAAEANVVRDADEKYYYPDEDLKLQIKALLARNIWDAEAYFVVINAIDTELSTAIDLLQNEKQFSELQGK